MRPASVQGHLDGMLLAILADHPAHGYAVIEALRTRSRGELDLPEGTVYPALHRLERAGLLASRWEDGSGRRRRVYRLSRSGQTALTGHRREWRSFTRVVSGVLEPRVT